MIQSVKLKARLKLGQKQWLKIKDKIVDCISYKQSTRCVAY